MADFNAPPQFPVDSELEAEFNRQGFKFKREPRFELSRLTVIEEAQVRGITDRSDPATVTRYAEAMRAGASFPAGIAAEVKDGMSSVITPVDTHHRAAASQKIGRTTMPMYVLTGVSIPMLKALAVGRNRHHGKLLSDAETLKAVAELAEEGMSAEHIVRLTGLSRAKVDRAVHALRFEQRVKALELPLTADLQRRLDKLGQTARANLSRQIQHDPVFAETTKLALEAGMNGTEASVLTKQVANTKSDADALKLLKEERALRTEQIALVASGFETPRPSYVQQFRMHCAGLLALKPANVADHNPSTREESARLARELFDFALALTNLYSEGAANNGQATSAAA